MVEWLIEGKQQVFFAMIGNGGVCRFEDGTVEQTVSLCLYGATDRSATVRWSQKKSKTIATNVNRENLAVRTHKKQPPHGACAGQIVMAHALHALRLDAMPTNVVDMLLDHLGTDEELFVALTSRLLYATMATLRPKQILKNEYGYMQFDSPYVHRPVRFKTSSKGLCTIRRLQWVRALPDKEQPAWVNQWNENTTALLAEMGARECVMWAHDNGAEWNHMTCANAAQNNDLEFLKHLVVSRCPMESSTCSSAAGKGHQRIIEWARAQGCEWDSFACEMAAFGGFLSLLQWLRKNGCPWDWRTYSAVQYRVQMKKEGAEEMMRWIDASDCPIPNMFGDLAPGIDALGYPIDEYEYE